MIKITPEQIELLAKKRAEVLMAFETENPQVIQDLSDFEDNSDQEDGDESAQKDSNDNNQDQKLKLKHKKTNF